MHAYSFRRSSAWAGMLAVALVLGGCSSDKILDVDDPDVVRPGSINDVTALPAISAAAIGEFAYAFGGDGGDNEGLISYGGLLGDEWIASGTFPSRVETDRRTIQEDNERNNALFVQLQRARASAQNAVDAYTRLQPGAARGAEAHNLVGYTYVLAGEHYCSGVPFSRVDANNNFTYGSPLTTEQIFQAAVQQFDSALVVLAADTVSDEDAIDEQTYLASVGKARALLNLGQFTAAAAAVSGANAVPSAFVYNIGYSDNTVRQQNGVWEFSNNEGRFSVADREGGNGLAYISADDPRVTSEELGVGFDNSTPLFGQLKYSTKDADIPLATGIEARLIEAEAALQSGNLTGFLTNLNAARARFTGLTPIAAVPASTAARVNLLFQERAFDLWLTAHRLGDMRRLLRPPYGRSGDAVFPTGEFFKGEQYGNDVSLPVPRQEGNNPNFQSCDNTRA